MPVSAGGNPFDEGMDAFGRGIERTACPYPEDSDERLCHVGEFYLSIGRVCRRPSVMKSTSYAGGHRPKTTSKSLILGQRDNASQVDASINGCCLPDWTV
jgi:hypothetical protein